MRVLVCIPCLMTGGTEIQTLSLVEALIKAGHTVNAVCYFEHTPLMVERYRVAGAEVTLLSKTGERPAGLKTTVGLLWRGLKSAVKSFGPDVAHVQYMAPGALPIVILRALGVKKIVATSHTDGAIYSANGLKVIRFLTNHVLTAFQCITERAESSYFGCSRLFDGIVSKHFTIYNNIPSHIFILSEPRKPKSEGADITVGVVSRLEAIKGMDLVVPAFAKAFRRNHRLRLLVVGDGSQRRLMERQAADEGLADRIEFAGRKAQTGLQDYYDRIDILLMPSRSEGFGLTAIEGMARGWVPVVANVGGLPEVVSPGTGLLHEPENIADIADKIIGLLSDNTKFHNLTMAATAKSLEFSKDRYNNDIKTFYSQI